MIRLSFNFLVVLFLGLVFQACNLYDAAFVDTKGTSTSSSVDTTTSITVSPSGQSFSTADSVVFSASGGTGSFTFSLSGQTNDFSGASISSSTSNTSTVTFTIPTALEGTQALTMTAMDGNSTTGVATLTLAPVTS